ncbi:MAG: radical SAM protein [Clostridia bacterium]|nr:radical SAM protein [Clostridia bacterium]
MEICNICPRRCGVDRRYAHGYCGEGDRIRIARAAAHYWEEPCISGTRGSGAVFFGGCNMGCVFCQNGAISRGGRGRLYSDEETAAIFLRLEGEGVHNLNLVTPTHFTPHIKRALGIAHGSGFGLPVVWNSGGYECAETVKGLSGLVDVYMPDFKYMSGELGRRYSNAADYAQVAKAALDEMVMQRGEARFEDGIMTRGVIVRHLVLPDCAEDSRAVLSFLHRRYGNAIYISLMKQYTPMKAGLPDGLSRRLDDREYDALSAYALRLGIEQGFFQEGDPVGESFIPEFDLIGEE